MYQVYLRDILLPVVPSDITVTTNNRNETIDLINSGEINILKDKGLDTIGMTVLLPNVDYPFSAGVDDFTRANYYIDRFEKFRANKEVFHLVILRYFPNGKIIFSTDKTVTLEELVYTESAENGFDFEASITLKEYKEYKTRVVQISQATDGTPQISSVVAKPNNAINNNNSNSSSKTYTVQKGDTLWAIAKRCFDDGSRYKELAEINNIMNPNFIQIGQIIKLQA